MATIGLCMIVKNESHVVLRCLESVLPLVDYVLVEDTGSTDGTQEIVRDWLRRTGLPGVVIEEPWRDFAYNRSHALSRLRQNKGVDYALVIDADDSVVLDEGVDVAALKSSLSADLYYVDIRNVHQLRYRRSQICSNRIEFRYRGVLHEFMEGPREGYSSGNANGFHMFSSREGARNQDPEKYRKDAEVLEKALQSEQDPLLRSRYTYYLARSLQEAGEKEKALSNYLKRAELGHWDQEIFDGLCAAAGLMRELGHPVDDVLAMYLRASDIAPFRAEALHGASRLCREHERYDEGYEYARRGLSIAFPEDGLFVQAWVYEYGLLDELAVTAYWTDRFAECVDACDSLLSDGRIPAQERERVQANRNFAEQKLRPASAGHD